MKDRMERMQDAMARASHEIEKIIEALGVLNASMMQTATFIEEMAEVLKKEDPK